MKTKLIILLIGIAFVGCGRSFSQTIPENKSKTTLQLIGVVSDINKNRLRTNMDIYILGKKLKSYTSNENGKFDFNLFLKNEYKIVIYKNGYDSCTLYVDTRMSNKTEETDAKFGFSSPFEIRLKKPLEESMLKNPSRIYYDKKSGYFEIDKEANQKEFTPPIKYEGEIMTIVEKMPEFKGGQPHLFAYLGTNVNYPPKAKVRDIQGTVYVSFIVDKNGVIKDVKVIKGTHPLLDAEAVRVVEAMPAWNPGEQGGEKVPVLYNLPITFKLGIEHINELNKNSDEYQEGVNYFGKKYYNKAIKMFTLSIKKNPEHIDSYYNRGVCYFKLDQKEAACEDWKRAKELGDKGAGNLVKEHCKQD